MIFMVFKTSDSEHFEIKDFKNFEDLFKTYSINSQLGAEGLILSDNFWYEGDIEEIATIYSISLETAEQISKIRWTIEIYDTWRE